MEVEHSAVVVCEDPPTRLSALNESSAMTELNASARCRVVNEAEIAAYRYYAKILKG